LEMPTPKPTPRCLGWQCSIHAWQETRRRPRFRSSLLFAACFYRRVELLSSETSRVFEAQSNLVTIGFHGAKRPPWDPIPPSKAAFTTLLHEKVCSYPYPISYDQVGLEYSRQAKLPEGAAGRRSGQHRAGKARCHLWRNRLDGTLLLPQR
jgi:hypothetical protein